MYLANFHCVCNASAVMSLFSISITSSNGAATLISLVCFTSSESLLTGIEPTFFGCSNFCCHDRPRSLYEFVCHPYQSRCASPFHLSPGFRLLRHKLRSSAGLHYQ